MLESAENEELCRPADVKAAKRIPFLVDQVSCKGQKWFLNAESDFRIGRHSLTQNARYTSIASAAAF